MDSEFAERRRRLVSLVDGHFSRDIDLVGRIVQEKTGAKISERTVQAWLIAPGRKSSRNCPEWAVKALEDYVGDSANRERLEQHATRREAASVGVKTPLAWSDEVRSSKAVEFATSFLEEEAQSLRVWQDAAGVHLGKMLVELERRLVAEMHSHRRTLVAINAALRSSSTYDECRSQFQEHVRASDLQDFFVRDAKRAIERGSDEFAAPDAVLQQPSPTSS